VLAALSLAVAAIPEGLPSIITIALAIGVRRMAGRRAVIRRLPAVETLGSTTVICSDKTGTLTKNEMTVQRLWTRSGAFQMSGVGYEPQGELTWPGKGEGEPPRDVLELLLAGVLCSDASLRRKDDDWEITGDPTEAALVVAAAKVGCQADAVRSRYERRDVIPFESERQLMATLHHDPDAEGVLYAKGSPEAILARCKAAPGFDHAQVLGEAGRFAAEGMRVLAFARRVLPRAHATLHEADIEGHLDFLGLQAMIDPPRQEAAEAVKDCRKAGITVKMITGDHRETARAIARELGILDGGTVLTGEELSRLSDDELRRSVRSAHVFARVAPEHKLRLVAALQAEQEVTAMTGDGVNDAPALKQSDIGIAMGVTGTAVAKEAADVVLTDDNFASIRAAVEEGRRVYDNLVKSLAFVLPTNLGEALIILIAVAFFKIEGGEPLMPILPVQILWINLVATVALALPLAFEAKEPDLMRRPPRAPDTPLLGSFVVGRTVLVALLMTVGGVGLFLYEYDHELGKGVAEAIARREAQTMAVTTVILFQVFYLLNCRSLKDSLLKIGLWTNGTVYAGIGAVLLLQLLFVYAPWMNELFGSSPLNLDAWVKSVLVALSVLPVVSLEKLLRQKQRPSGRRTGLVPAKG
jgi:Ca2+-transporting ATPase